MPLTADDLAIAIETSTRRGSIALLRGERVLAEHPLDVDRAHTAALLPTLHAALHAQRATPRDVRLVCFARGPGSFTGLRVASTVARLLRASLGVEVAAVSTLDAIAQNALRAATPPARVAVIYEGRAGRALARCYALDAATPAYRELDDESTVDVAAWLASLPRPLAAIGPGVAAHHESCRRAGVDFLPAELAAPGAAAVGLLGMRAALSGRFTPVEQIVPTYSRPPECEEVYESRRAAAVAKRPPN